MLEQPGLTTADILERNGRASVEEYLRDLIEPAKKNGKYSIRLQIATPHNLARLAADPANCIVIKAQMPYIIQMLVGRPYQLMY